MVYGFDFDGVCTDINIQMLIRKLRQERNEIWVVTMRRDNEFSRKEMKPVLDRLFIPSASIIFSNGKPKCELLKAINADIYIDNISTEFGMIRETTKAIPLLFN